MDWTTWRARLDALERALEGWARAYSLARRWGAEVAPQLKTDSDLESAQVRLLQAYWDAALSMREDDHGASPKDQ